MEPGANTLRKHKTTGDVHDLGICANWISRRYHHWCRGHGVLVIVSYVNSRHCSTNWKKTKLSWKSTVKSWLATLLAARNCWIPWRMITASCTSIWRKAPAACWPEMSAESNPFRNRLAESEASNDQAPVQMPRDYSEGASGLLRSGAKRD
ncbi:cytochrome d ubiquinol oxidase subunit III [Salmonella enterica subsp. enterica]|nr:cytochrome d ubiquinol oxidase subunit III [Salmonella enterica subsp. enterica]